MTTSPPKLIGWEHAFPAEHTARAVAFLHETWLDLMQNQTKGFNRKSREDKLTVLFGAFLDDRSVSVGRLTGKWFYEVPSVTIANRNTQKPSASKSIRKDIIYFSDADPSKRLHLIFEFKKVSDDSRSVGHYCGLDGVRRFVDGEYAKGEPLALMVGMLLDDEKKCISRIQERLNRDKTLLMMVDFGGENFIQTPSAYFSATSFDTQHQRPNGLANPHSGIALAHLFLSLPSA